ncbi:alpha-N-acetylgalactosaminidase [Ixodes scapularis]
MACFTHNDSCFEARVPQPRTPRCAPVHTQSPDQSKKNTENICFVLWTNTGAGMRLRCPLSLGVALLLATSAQGLDNGLARTPPMGWLSWERFLCNVDCARDPENCISERLYMTMANIMHKEGYQEVGYQYVNVDDCWMANSRQPDGSLMANSTRFPSGMKKLGDFIHSKGLKFGIYQDCGTQTCAGYPGSLCHYVQDARTFAEWGVDMLKLDGCNINPIFMDRLYPAVTSALNATGRKIVFSCSWPAYQVDAGMKPNYPAIARSCNMWRNFDDITDSWVSVLHIVDYYASVQDTLTAVSGPGRWSDPDMIHSKGLKFGIYQDCGTQTCAGYPGSLCHYVQDARTFAEWGVDMLKLDGCNINPIFMDRLYPAVTSALNATGRKIVFSCSWPAYQVDAGMKPNYPAIARSCNMWRNFDDITDSWVSVLHIVDYYASVQDTLTAVSGPGRWSDPDMLIIGNYGLSLDQSRAQMALWAILAAPLFMSADLRTIRPEHKDILTNRLVIAINQDPLGRMGRRICVESGVEIWARAVLPLADDKSTSAAIVFFNRRNLGGPVNVTIKLAGLSLVYRNGYDVLDLFNPGAQTGWFMPTDDLTAMVNPSGVVMLKATPRIPPTTPPPPKASPLDVKGGGIKGGDVLSGVEGASTPMGGGIKGGEIKGGDVLSGVKGAPTPMLKVTNVGGGGTKGGMMESAGVKGALMSESKGGAVTEAVKGSAAKGGVKTK